MVEIIFHPQEELKLFFTLLDTVEIKGRSRREVKEPVSRPLSVLAVHSREEENVWVSRLRSAIVIVMIITQRFP